LQQLTEVKRRKAQVYQDEEVGGGGGGGVCCKRGAEGAKRLLMTIYRQKAEDTDSLTYRAANGWGCGKSNKHNTQQQQNNNCSNNKVA